MKEKKKNSLSTADQRKHLLVDMDGTLAKFTPVDTLEKLYEPGYFSNLEPIDNVLSAVKLFIKEHPEVEVSVLSSVLSDSPYAINEKNAWLDEHLPEVNRTHRYFPPCGADKKEAIPGGVNENHFLLDDYTKNLASWEPPAIGIKLLNGINHTKGSWPGNRISAFKTSEEISKNIFKILNGEMVTDLQIREGQESTTKDIDTKKGINPDLGRAADRFTKKVTASSTMQPPRKGFDR